MSSLRWFNYVTQTYESFKEENMREYFPQTPASLHLYDLYVETGKTPIQACQKVLEAHCSPK